MGDVRPEPIDNPWAWKIQGLAGIVHWLTEEANRTPIDEYDLSVIETQTAKLQELAERLKHGNHRT